VIYSHPGVLEPAVVGRARPVYGEVPVAFVSCRTGEETGLAGLLEHLRKSVAKYRLPAEIVNITELPWRRWRRD
jgi:long-chain acyl-CoA synthetase